MALGLLGYKIGMMQVFEENGNVAPVTVLQLGPCPVLQIRTPERDGYTAVQVGFQDKSRKRATRAERGHVTSQLESKLKSKRRSSHKPLWKRLEDGRDPRSEQIKRPPKAECEPQKFIREFRLVDNKLPENLAVGNRLTVDSVFENIQTVDVTGTSKGRGTAGVMKRHGFAGLPASHGAKKVHRQAGSTGSLASNRSSGRPKKGLRRAGRHGNARVTVKNLRVVKIDRERNLMLVCGAVPGPNGGLVMVRPSKVNA
jgi:large subunit ribosomal protein L3